jgi:hypothetical protein
VGSELNAVDCGEAKKNKSALRTLGLHVLNLTGDWLWILVLAGER